MSADEAAKELVRELIDMALPCNAQHPDLENYHPDCPEDHPHCCGRCELLHRARKFADVEPHQPKKDAD